MGLPSNIPPPPANLFGPATTPEPNPFLTNSSSANPFEAPAPSTTPDPIPAVPFEVAATVPAMSPMSDLAPSTQRMPSQFPPPPSVPVHVVNNAPRDVMMLSADDTHHDHEESGAPSRQDLLQRAAAMPPRMSFESIVFQPTDPILINKQQPRVAERRARFRKVVKVALGACVALCLVGTAATALSSSNNSSSSSSSKTMAKTAPAAAVVPVEKLELAATTKATSSNPQHAGVTAARPAPSPALKKRR